LAQQLLGYEGEVALELGCVRVGSEEEAGVERLEGVGAAELDGSPEGRGVRDVLENVRHI